MWAPDRSVRCSRGSVARSALLEHGALALTVSIHRMEVAPCRSALELAGPSTNEVRTVLLTLRRCKGLCENVPGYGSSEFNGHSVADLPGDLGFRPLEDE